MITYEYTFDIKGYGFAIRNEANGEEIEVYTDCYAIYVPTFDKPEGQFFNPIATNSILTWIARYLMDEDVVNEEGKSQIAPRGLSRWRDRLTRRALAGRAVEQLNRLRARMDEKHLAINKAIFEATFRGHVGIKNCPFDDYVVSDIIKYRPAAVAAVRFEQLAKNLAVRQILESSEWKEMESAAAAVGFDRRLLAPLRWIPEINESCMTNWRDLYSYSGAAYPTLNKTLMQWPGGIPAALYENLQWTKLVRPLTTRLELLLALYWAGTDKRHNFHLLEGVTQDQIKRAMKLVSDHVHFDLNPRRSRDVAKFVGFIADYPERHKGNIVGLTRKSIHWHRDEYRAAAEREAKKLGCDTAAAIPPIELPSEDGVAFLSTVRNIVQEGEMMGHCVGSYTRKAVNGHCYLFHVIHDEQIATVEVSACERKVVQAAGPGNCRNKAASWGKRLLNRWAKSLPEFFAR